MQESQPDTGPTRRLPEHSWFRDVRGGGLVVFTAVCGVVLTAFGAERVSITTVTWFVAGIVGGALIAWADR